MDTKNLVTCRIHTIGCKIHVAVVSACAHALQPWHSFKWRFCLPCWVSGTRLDRVSWLLLSVLIVCDCKNRVGYNLWCTYFTSIRFKNIFFFIFIWTGLLQQRVLIKWVIQAVYYIFSFFSVTRSSMLPNSSRWRGSDSYNNLSGIDASVIVGIKDSIIARGPDKVVSYIGRIISNTVINDRAMHAGGRLLNTAPVV